MVVGPKLGSGDQVSPDVTNIMEMFTQTLDVVCAATGTTVGTEKATAVSPAAYDGGAAVHYATASTREEVKAVGASSRQSTAACMLGKQQRVAARCELSSLSSGEQEARLRRGRPSWWFELSSESSNVDSERRRKRARGPNAWAYSDLSSGDLTGGEEAPRPKKERPSWWFQLSSESSNVDTERRRKRARGSNAWAYSDLSSGDSGDLTGGSVGVAGGADGRVDDGLASTTLGTGVSRAYSAGKLRALAAQQQTEPLLRSGGGQPRGPPSSTRMESHRDGLSSTRLGTGVAWSRTYSAEMLRAGTARRHEREAERARAYRARRAEHAHEGGANFVAAGRRRELGTERVRALRARRSASAGVPPTRGEESETSEEQEEESEGSAGRASTPVPAPDDGDDGLAGSGEESEVSEDEGGGRALAGRIGAKAAEFEAHVMGSRDAQVAALEPISVAKQLAGAVEYRRLMADAVNFYVCAVCGVRESNSRLMVTKAFTDLRFEMLEYKHSHEGGREFRDALGQRWALDVEGVKEVTGEVQCCPECARQLSVGKVPRRALAMLDPGLPSLELQFRGGLPRAVSGGGVNLPPLTPVERALVAPLRVHRYIVMVKNTRVGLRGSTFAMANNPARAVEEAVLRTCRVLPGAVEDLPNYFRVVLTGAVTDRDELIRRVRGERGLQVRPLRVVMWARHIARLFPECTRFSEENAGALLLVPDGTLPVEVGIESGGGARTEDETELNAVAGEAGHMEVGDPAVSSGYAPGTSGGPDELAGDAFRAIGVVDVDGGMHDRAAQGAATRLVAACSGELVTDYGDDYFHKVYPDLFPYRQGGPPRGSIREWASTLLLRHKSVFAIDPAFIFDAANIYLRHETTRRAKLSIKGARADELSSLKLQDLQDVVRVMQNPARGRNLTLSSGAQTLRRSTRAVVNQLPGAPGSKARLLPRLMAALHAFGPPTFMVNINPADQHNPPCFQFAGCEVSVNEEGVTMTMLDDRERARVIAENPIAAALFFKACKDAFLEAFLEWDPVRKTFKRWDDETRTFGPNRSAFGEVLEAHFTYETNGRGGLHTHGLVWTRGVSAGSLLAAARDEDGMQARVLRFLESVSRAWLPPPPPSHRELAAKFDGDPDEFRDCRDRMGWPKASALWPPVARDEETLLQQVWDIAVDLHHHECQGTCFKGGKKKCRMAMPRKIEPVSCIRNGALVLRRTVQRLVSLHLGTAVAMRCNAAIYACCEQRGDLGNAADIASNAVAIAMYIIKYISKDDEVDLEEALKGLERSAPLLRETPHRAVTGVANAMHRGHTMSGPLAAAVLLSMGDCFTSYETRALLVRPIVEQFKQLATGTASGDIVREEGQLCVLPHGEDYIERSRASEGLSPYMHCALMDKRALWRRRVDEAARFLPGHKQHNSKQEFLRKRHVFPMLVGQWPDDDDEAEWELYGKALFSHWRRGDNPAEVPEPDGLGKYLLQNVRVQARCSHRAPEMQGAEDVVAGPVEQELVPPAPVPLSEFAAEANAVAQFQRSARLAVRRVRGVDEPAGGIPAVLRNDDVDDDVVGHDGHGDSAERGAMLVPGGEEIGDLVDAAIRSLPPTIPLNVQQRSVAERVLSAVIAPPDEPLVELILGAGGTGKTNVVKAIVEGARHLGLESKLLLVGFTARSAVLMAQPGVRYGTTSSVLAIDSVGNNRPRTAGEALVRSRELLRTRTTMLVDEVSMISCAHLKAMATQCVAAAQGQGDEEPAGLFGNMNVIFFGDHLQLPPPGGRSLFKASDRKSKAAERVGRQMFESIQKVVLLERVERQGVDAGGMKLRAVNERIRETGLTRQDLRELNERTLGKPGMPAGLDSPELRGARVLVLRNEVKKAIIRQQVRRWAAEAGEQLLWWHSMEGPRHAFDDRPKKGRGSEGEAKIPAIGYYFRGMRCITLGNRSVKLNFVHNNTGYMRGIVLDGREVLGNEPEQELKYMPKCIMVQIDKSEVEVRGFERGVVPVTVCKARVNHAQGRQKVTVTRAGFPLVPEAAFTDFYAQGATFDSAGPPVVLDLVPPKGCRSLYCDFVVALSRARSWEQVYLLRPLWRRAVDEDAVCEKLSKLLRQPAELQAESFRLRQLADQYAATLGTSGAQGGAHSGRADQAADVSGVSGGRVAGGARAEGGTTETGTAAGRAAQSDALVASCGDADARRRDLVHRMTRERNSWFVMPLLRAAVNGESLEGTALEGAPADVDAEQVVRLVRQDLAGRGVEIPRGGYINAREQEKVLDMLGGDAHVAVGNLYAALT